MGKRQLLKLIELAESLLSMPDDTASRIATRKERAKYKRLFKKTFNRGSKLK